MRTCHLPPPPPPATATATAMADSGEPPPPLCPLCGHPTASSSPSPSLSASAGTARPPLKRKAPPEAPPAVVRVEIGDEAAALREALARQHGALGDLQAELDAERGAAAGAASEAMTMILRLQREKAEAMMEARQFRRYAEEKMSHDAAELAALEDVLAKRDAALRALQSSSSRGGGGRATPSVPGSSPLVCSSPHHYPSTPTPASAAAAANYPPLRCFIDHPPTASEADALDAQTPREHLTRLAHRVHMLERGVHPTATTTTTTPIIRVAPGSAFPRPTRAYSDADSLDFCDGEYFPDDVDCGASDRVYTVDAIHGRPLAVPEGSCTPAGSSCCGGGAPWAEDEEMRRLSARLQALEADRETMRQAIVSMGAEKAQVVLLKEIAQQLCKEATPPLPPPAVTVGHNLYKGASAPPAVTVKVRPPKPPVVMHRRVIDAPPVAKTSCIATVAKWFTSIISRRKKTPRTKFPIGQCGNNVGLLLLLDKAPRPGHGHQKMPKKI